MVKIQKRHPMKNKCFKFLSTAQGAGCPTVYVEKLEKGKCKELRKEICNRDSTRDIRLKSDS